MNRRDFLSNLFGVAVVAALPNLPLIEAAVTTPTIQEWETAINRVWVASLSDLIIYGTSAIRQIDTFPFIENVPLEELRIPMIKGGLFSDSSL